MNKTCVNYRIFLSFNLTIDKLSNFFQTWFSIQPRLIVWLIIIGSLASSNIKIKEINAKFNIQEIKGFYLSRNSFQSKCNMYGGHRFQPSVFCSDDVKV